MLDKNFQKRYTRSQASEMTDALERLENMQLFGDDDFHDPKGDVVNYALMTNVKLEPSTFE